MALMKRKPTLARTEATARKALKEAGKSVKHARGRAATLAQKIADKVTGRDQRRKKVRRIAATAAGVAVAAVAAGVALTRKRSPRKRK